MTQYNAPSYEIERPTGQCALTGQVLVPGEPYMATLVESDEETAPSRSPGKKSAVAVLGLKRMDICWEAWEQGRRPDRIFCYWKSTVAEPNQKKRLFVDDGVLMNLFRRLADADEQPRVAFRFVLGLILMRKKLLRYNGTTRRQVNGGDEQAPSQEDWWQVTAKLDLSKGPMGKWNEEDHLKMLDPHLDEQQIQEVTEQIGEVLEAEL